MSENWNKVTKSLSYLAVNRKWILWTVLILGGFFFLNKRYTSVNGSFKTVDVIILLFWISLIIMPFFQEINFYGLKLKKEIDELKFDINKQFFDLSREFISLRSEINNSNDNHTQITNYYNPNSNQLSDDKLSQLGKEFEEASSAKGIKPPSESDLTKVPGDVLYLFSVRYQIEKELKRILNEIPSIAHETSLNNKIRNYQTSRAVDYLARLDYIDSNVANIIMQIHGITSRAIHGEDISKGQYYFVYRTAPDLIAILKEIT